MKRMLKKFCPFILLMLLTACFLSPASAAGGNAMQIAATTTSATLSWSYDSNVTSYDVYKYDSETSSWSYLGSLASDASGVTITKLEAGSKYAFRIYYATSYGTSYFTFYDVKTLPERVTSLQNVLDEKTRFYLNWDKQDGVDGYEYAVLDTKGVVQKRGNVYYGDSYSYMTSISDLSTTKIYQIRVRAYVTINGEVCYGEWSDPIWRVPQPNISLKKSSSKVSFKWNKISGASGYDIYISVNSKSAFKKVKSVGANTTSYSGTKINGKKFSKKNNYYVYVVAKTKINGETCRSRSDIYTKIYWSLF